MPQLEWRSTNQRLKKMDGRGKVRERLRDVMARVLSLNLQPWKLGENKLATLSQLACASLIKQPKEAKRSYEEIEGQTPMQKPQSLDWLPEEEALSSDHRKGFPRRWWPRVTDSAEADPEGASCKLRCLLTPRTPPPSPTRQTGSSCFLEDLIGECLSLLS